MKTSTAIGIKDYIEFEVPEQKEYLNRELFKERTIQLIEQIKSGNIELDSEFLPSINAFIEEDIKSAMKTKDGFKKGFTIVEATVNGIKKVKAFSSRSLAIKVMDYIRETYPNINIKYHITQM